MANMTMALGTADMQELMELTMMQDEMNTTSMPHANVAMSQDDLKNAQLDRTESQLTQLQTILQMMGCESDGSKQTDSN